MTRARERVPVRATVAARAGARTRLVERVPVGHARATFEHWRPTPDGKVLLWRGRASNLLTDAGIDFLHTQGYGTAGLAANGLNWIALSDLPLTETAASTTLSGEIVLNGFARAQGVVTHVAGTTLTTIAYTFTATGPQGMQKAALFTTAGPPPAGTMNHVLAFAPRLLALSDMFAVMFEITLG